MRQLFLQKPLDLVLREVEPPHPGPGEVTVQVKAALTCGTDLKFYRRGHPRWPLPSGFGHEFSGLVLEVGEGVSLPPGTPVMLAPSAPCGGCRDCQRGLSNLCPQCMQVMILGAFADVVRVPAPVVAINLYPKPPELDWWQAALLEPLSCVVYGLSLVNASGTVAILGAGPIGLLYAALARSQGAERVLLAGRHALRRQVAERLGAEVLPEAELPGQAVQAAGGADLVIECTGQPAVWEDAVHAARRGGTVLFYGGCPGGTTFKVDPAHVLGKGLCLKGAFHFTPAAVARARDLLIAGAVPVQELITDVYPLDRYQEAFQRLDRGEAVKLGLEP